MSNLQLSLKKQWFYLTKSGVKTEDYREINSYWSKRLVYNLKDVLLRRKSFFTEFIDEKDAYDFITNNIGKYGFNDFDSNVMTLGYPKSTDSERIIKLEHKGIEIREGNPEWGAIPGRKYFVILHGSFLK